MLERKLSEETKIKIGLSLSKKVHFNCDYCGKESSDKPSHYKRTKRHFCSRICYSLYRRDFLPKEEQHAYGNGYSKEERQARRKARTILNHAIRDGKLKRKPCQVCGEKAEAHHDDYSKPLEVKWFCFKHHREHHKKAHDNPELLQCES